MRALIVAGVLGAGTLLVFAAAAVTATLFPNGTIVNSGWGGGPWMEKGGWGGPAMPVPMPAPNVIVDGKGWVAPDNGFRALPGDVVVTLPAQEDLSAP